MTTTIDRPAPVNELHELDEHDERVETQNRRLKVAVAVLAIITLGLGIALIGVATDSDSDVPAEIRAALDEFERATEEEDVDGLEALVTDDYFFTREFYRPGELTPLYATAGSVAVATNRFATTQDFLMHYVSDPIVTGDGPWFVLVDEESVNEFTLYEGVGRYTLVDEDGVIKIAAYDWTGVATPVQPDWGG